MNDIAIKSDYCIKRCKAWCCKYIVVKYDEITNIAQDTKLFFSLRGIKIFENGDLIIPLRCKWLNKHDKCTLYPYRPKDCVAYECKHLKDYVKGYFINEKKENVSVTA